MFSHGKSKRDGHGRQKKLRDQSESVPEEEIKEYLVAKKPQKALSERFVWWKKIEKDVQHGKPLDELFSMKAQRRRHREKMAELEKLKKAKEKRAMARARHEEDMAFLARERARAEFQDWEKKEEDFCFDQSKVRSKIRLRQGRAKPIDVLYKHLDRGSELSDDVDIDLSSEPYMVFKGLTVQDLEELRDDIKMYLDSDRATSTRVKYWEALLVVCDWELTEARKRDALEFLAQEKGLHADVEADVRKLLDGKTHSELVQIQLHIESQLFSGVAKVVEYWEAVRKLLDIYKAKACLKEIHAETLRRHLHRLENVHSDAEEEAYSQEEAGEEEEEAGGSFSPELMHGDDDDREEPIDPEEDKELLETKRMVVLERQKKRLKVKDNLEVKAMKAMGAMEEGDAVFGSNAEVVSLDSEWRDKYRPRKPKYVNRVHTSYEWNKYNQTHYDHENPPPKVVQGYKFNIFYPDLLDKATAPTCFIEKDGTIGDETCIIRFQAGPPYEDIAFRIVNKEWERSRKNGFKHTFDGGILHLYFNFKRHRYRR